MVERGFATLYSRMRMMMMHAGLHKNLNTGPWTECAATAKKIKNIMVNPHEENARMRSSIGKFQTNNNT